MTSLVALARGAARNGVRRPLERGAAMMAHPLRALARTILALVAPVPAALEGRMWMRIGPRAVTCLSDSAHWRERENRTESHNGDCFEHLRLEAALGLITRNLVKGSRLKVFAAVSPSRLNLPAICQPQ